MNIDDRYSASPKRNRKRIKLSSANKHKKQRSEKSITNSISGKYSQDSEASIKFWTEKLICNGKMNLSKNGKNTKQGKPVK